jgi:hypothetical protein
MRQNGFFLYAFILFPQAPERQQESGFQQKKRCQNNLFFSMFQASPEDEFCGQPQASPQPPARNAVFLVRLRTPHSIR